VTRLTLPILTAILFAAPAFAQFSASGAGGGGPVATAAAAADAPDEAPVALTGAIVERLGPERYRFRDASGEVTLDIDEDLWRGRRVGPETTIRVTGEVDRGLVGMDIWVRGLEIVE
jgi:uncharacterized protein (TIGR00156 family)